MKCGYIFQSNSSLGDPVLAISSSDSIPKLKEEIKALQQKFDVLQRRFWLEPLEPIWQYRGKFYLGKTKDVEDKDQVTPFLLANFVDASNKTLYRRRIYIDLGIKDFNSSLCWMMQNYPIKFDAMYGFECERDMTNVATLRDPINRCISETAAEKMGYTTEGTMDTLKVYHNFIGLDEDLETSPHTRGLSQFLKDIDIQEDDFVVLKMDVEGIEFSLLERMMANGTYKLIDEIFVEIHYRHPDMQPFGWDIFEHSLSDAQALFTKARDMGIYIHPWP
ncbi:Hypothetical protein NocV09_04300250 [Nannochloropsis oceanica]